VYFITKLRVFKYFITIIMGYYGLCSTLYAQNLVQGVTYNKANDNLSSFAMKSYSNTRSPLLKDPTWTKDNHTFLTNFTLKPNYTPISNQSMSPFSHLSLVSSLDMQTWYGAWDRTLSRLYHQYDLKLTHVIQVAQERKDISIYLTLQAQAGSDLSLNKENYAYSNGAPLVELWIPTAQLHILIPRMNLQVHVGRQNTFATHRMVVIDGLSWNWQSQPQHKISIKMAQFVGQVPITAYHNSGGSRWGQGWTQSLYLNSDRDSYRWNNQRTDDLQRRSVLAPTSVTETKALWQIQGWRVGGQLAIGQRFQNIQWQLKLLSDQRHSMEQVTEERLGYLISMQLYHWQFQHGLSYDSLLNEWGIIWAELMSQWSHFILSFRLQSQKNLWPLDSIWWVFAQRAEQRLSMKMGWHTQKYIFSINPYAFRFASQSNQAFDTNNIKSQLITNTESQLSTLDSFAYVGEEGIGISTFLQWPNKSNSTYTSQFISSINQRKISSRWQWHTTFELGRLNQNFSTKTWSSQLIWFASWLNWGWEQHFGLQQQQATRANNQINTPQRQSLRSAIIWRPSSTQEQYMPWVRSVYYLQANQLIKIKADLSLSYSDIYWFNAMLVLESNPW
jgi:hypothetical protein